MTIIRQEVRATGAIPSTSDTKDNKGAASDYIFSKLVEAERASQSAAAQSPDGTMNTLSIRYDDRIFHIGGKPIDKSLLKATPIAELPEDQYQGALDALERMRDALSYKLENMTSPVMPDSSTYAAYQNYAAITVGGRVIGRVDNQGVLSIYDDAQGSMVTKALEGIDRTAAASGITQGPALAQFRAERIAGMLGAKVTKLPTALTQSQFNAAPKLNPEDYRPHVDLAALRRDPEYIQVQKQIQDIKTARAEYLARQNAQAAVA